MFIDESFPSDHRNPNPSSTQEYYNNPPFLFTNNNSSSPPPFLDDHDSPLNQIFLFHKKPQPPPSLLKCDTIDDSSSSKLDEKEKEVNRIISRGNTISPLKRRNLGAIPRRRAGKKDRHSKICTAQGIRDRRMRLSLHVARKFFDLQDTLGYDKASQTIEWLFNQSKGAIKELAKNDDQEKSHDHIEEYSDFNISECDQEPRSGIIEENSNNNNLMMPFCAVKDEIIRKPSKRELREKARARARCRTLEKMMNRWSRSNPSEQDRLSKLGFLNSPFEGVFVDDGHREPKYETNNQFVCDSIDHQNQHLADVGTIEKLLMGNSQSSSFDTGIFGNWDASNNIDRTNSIIDYGVATIDQEEPLAGKP